jgi:hypothetical protein
MKTVLKLFSKLALVAVIIVAFAFGATEAAACATCTQPDTTCVGEANPNLFCAHICVNVQGCPWGECDPGPDECVCVV